MYFSLNTVQQPSKSRPPNSKTPGGLTHTFQNGSHILDEFLTAADFCPAWLGFTYDQAWKQTHPFLPFFKVFFIS